MVASTSPPLMNIRSKILRTGLVHWKKFKFLQTDRLKRFPPELEARLRESMVANNFVMSFRVWESKGELYCLDGFHRCLILRQLEERGYKVPDELPAEFIECKSKREAAKLVLVYSSHYAEISKTDLNAFILEHGLNVDQLSEELNLLFTKASGVQGDEDEDRPEAEYPIEARFSEEYDYVLIFSKNSVDFAHLAQMLRLETKRSYKNTAVGVSRVLTYEEFMERWRSK
jgi:hypothetical protein